MSKEYYQMGWTLDDNYEEDYFCSRDNHRYFIKKNTTPMIATLSAEGIVPTLRWTRRMSNGDVLIAQDTAERVKQAATERSHNIIHHAEQESQRLLDEAKYKANEILRQATDNAKKVAIETEELKNKSRVFHQRLKSTIESQLAIVDSSDWEEILRPTATYLQTSDEVFKEVVREALGENISAFHEEEANDLTRQFSPEEVAELQARIEATNRELMEAQDESTLSDLSSLVNNEMSSESKEDSE